MAEDGEVGDLLDQDLPEELQLAGDARGDLAHHQQAEAQHDPGRDQRGPHHVQVDGQAADVHHPVVLADGDVAAGEDEVHWIPCDITMRPTFATKSSWKMTSPATAPMPSGAVQEEEADADHRDDPEARHALGAHGAAQHLVADADLTALGLQLGDTGVEETEVQDRHAQPDDEPERRPEEAEQDGDEDADGADDQRGEDGAAQHLGQRAALEVSRDLRAGSRGDLYRYWRISLMTLKRRPSPGPTGGRRGARRVPCETRRPARDPRNTPARRRPRPRGPC